MPTFRIKLLGLSNIDKSSLTSILKLASDLLTHQWVVVEDGDAELSIYSFDSDEGVSAWQQRDNSFSALLTDKDNVSEPIDIILKKPLRATNFSEALNIIEYKITFAKKNQKTATITAATAKKEKVKTSPSKSSSLLSSLSSTLSKPIVIRKKKTSTSDIPPLTLKTVEVEKVAIPTATLTTGKLKAWLKQKNNDNRHDLITSCLANLIPLNRAANTVQNRLELLELYRTPIKAAILARDVSAIKIDLMGADENLAAIKAQSLIIEELAIGYKIIINELYTKGNKPISNKIFLFALSRAVEIIALHILHAYQYYHSAPQGAFHELHQLYLYAESHDVHQALAIYKSMETSTSIFHSYTQLMLTAIADPYSLAKFDAFRLFIIMDNLADTIEIKSLSNKQIKATSDFLMTGHFCIDTTSDLSPTVMAKTSIEIRALPHSRLLNTQRILLAIEELFQQVSSNSQDGNALDIQLLKGIIPQLNTTYVRKFQRLPPSTKQLKIRIAVGVSAIHTCLSEGHLNNTFEWAVHNQGSGGIMAHSENDQYQQLRIGDVIGIFEANLSIKLAEIRWLHIDSQGITQIGLAFLSGSPTAVICTPDGQAEAYPALKLPEIKDLRQAITLIAEKGIYSPRRVLRIKDGNTAHVITIKALINNTLNCEQFSYTINP